MSPHRAPLPFALSLAALLIAGAAVAESDHQHADAMHKEHKSEAPSASPAAALEPAQAVEGEEVVYATLDGKPIKGYLARPKAAAGGGKGLPAIIVIQEWWGLNDNIRAMARRYAGEGFQTLAVDLYEGEVATDADGARALMTKAMEQRARLSDNLRQAHRYLKEQRQAPKIGSVGWCFGGGWSLGAGLLLGKEIDAVVMFYGRVITDRAQLQDLQAPLLGLFGELDQGIPVAGVRDFEKALAELGKTATIVVYPGADHAFANPSGERYQAEAAQDSWTRSIEFFKKYLMPSA